MNIMKRTALVVLTVILAVFVTVTTVYADGKDDNFIIAPFASDYIVDGEHIYLKIKSGFNFLDEPSEKINWELALTAAVLSKEIYEAKTASDGGYESPVQDTLIALGYDSTTFYYAPGWNANQPVCCFGHMNDGEKNVFAIIVRGTKTQSDFWITDILDGGTQFFEDATYNVCDYFVEFAQTVTGKTLEQLKKEDNRFLITGHSLGGAVANRLSITDTIVDLARNDKNKIYTYTFEAPHTCQNYWWMNPQVMSNAFNIKDVDDIVPNVPPWYGATRYGTDLEFSVGYNADTLNIFSRFYFENYLKKYEISALNRVIWGKSAENLDNNIFTTFFPNAKGGNVIEAPRVYNYGNPFGHHDMGLPLTYILQKGIQANVWESVTDVLSVAEPQIIASYKIVKDERDKHGYDYVEVYFERPVFEEVTPGYQLINGFFEERSNEFFSDSFLSFENKNEEDTFWGIVEEFETEGNIMPLEYNVSAEVTYQSTDLVSVSLLYTKWFGGTDMLWKKNYLFYTDTGKRVILTEIIGETEEKIKDLIEQAIDSEYDLDDFNKTFVHDRIAEYALEDIDFYLKDQEIHITFPQYAILSGNFGIIDVTLPVLPELQ